MILTYIITIQNSLQEHFLHCPVGINVIMVAVYTVLKISFIIHMQTLRKILNHIPLTASSSAFVKSPQICSRED